jgi:hypothetical protein
MQGDYTQYRRWYTDKSLDRQIVAADDTTALNNIIAPKSANHQLFIQKLVFYETTESNGKSLTFQDDSSTQIVLGKYSSVTAAAGIPKSLVLDFGPKGYALGAGKNLDVVVSAAGIAGALHIEAYERIVSGGINTGTAAASQ